MVLEMRPEQLFTASKKLNNLHLEIENNLFSLEIFWCRVAYSKNAYWNFKEHTHSFFELHIPLSGKAIYSIEKQTITADKGILLLLPPHCKHTLLDVLDNYAEFVFGFDFNESEQLLQLLNDTITTYYFSNSNSYIYTLIHEILENAYEEKIGYRTAIESQLTCIIINILQTILKNLSIKHEKNHEITNTTRIRLAINYINDNLATATVGDIANSLHISTRQLNRLIYSALSMTTIELIVDKRIRAAKKLMQNSDDSISSIAEFVGFNSLQHFSKTFKKAEGISPSAYKQDLKK